MARQYSVDFDWIKRNADFRAILAHYGIAAVGQGEQVRIRCPFHDDRNPSCSVNWAENLFSCKAASCERQGNIIQFVQWLEGDQHGSTLSTRDAAKLVAEWSGIAPSPTGDAQGSRKRRSGPGTTEHPKNGRTAADEAPRAHNGGTQRRVDADSTAKWLERNPLDTKHPYLLGRLGPEAIVRFQPCGYVAKGKLAGYSMLPVHAVDGTLMAFIGRWAADTVPEDKEKYRFPPGFEKSAHLFGLFQIADRATRQWLVVVEGPMDAIRLQGLGCPAVSLLGSSLSDAQLALLREQCPALRLVLVLMDGDKGGRDAADRIAPKLGREFSVRIIDLPDGTDPASAPEETLQEVLPGLACRAA